MNFLYVLRHIPASIYLLKVNNRNTRNKVWNMFKVNNKDSRMTSMTSFWCLYCWLRTYFTPCSSVSISNFEHVIAGWDWPVLELMFICQRSLDSSLIIFQATSSWITVHEILKENTFLTHFLPLISFNTPWNIRKSVLLFSGGIERWHEMAWSPAKTQKNDFSINCANTNTNKSTIVNSSHRMHSRKLY